MNNEFIQKESIFKVGRVISIEGRSVRIIVNKNKNTSHILYRGELIRNVSVGGFVKIMKGFISIIGKVEGEYTNEDRLIEDKEYKNEKDKINRILKVSLVGFVENKKFERGIKELPLIDNECYLLERDEFESIHDFVKEGDVPIEIGNLSLENNMPIKIGINGLFASHIGIFGNTGSGKSYTLAKLYRQLFLKYVDNQSFKQNSRFFFLDFNGEYIKQDSIVDEKYKQIYKLSTRKENGEDKYPITKKQLEDVTFWSILLDATEKTQRPFLKRAIGTDYLKGVISDDVRLKEYLVDLFKKVWADGKGSLYNELKNLLLEIRDDCCSNAMEITRELDQKVKLHTQKGTPESFYVLESGSRVYYSANTEPFTRIINLVQISLPKNNVRKYKLLIILKYYDEVISGYQNQEHLAPLIKRLEKRIDEIGKLIEVKEESENKASEKNINVISFRDVNIEMRKMLPLLICKELYSTHKSQKEENHTLLNIIIDEAHNILSRDSDRESEIWKDYRLETFEEIIKEGRKFGVFLTIASQRPSDISGTIISQIHNFFLHRLINTRDIEAIEKSISYLDRVSFEYLPILPTGTCILAGVIVNMPVIIDIEKMEDKRFEPDSETLDLVNLWSLS
jgi:hypothetical protein